jgi:hypothetical protein
MGGVLGKATKKKHKLDGSLFILDIGYFWKSKRIIKVST